MKISELIARLEELKQQLGDVEVGYVDNGDFAENGGWIEPDPHQGTEGDNKVFVVL